MSVVAMMVAALVVIILVGGTGLDALRHRRKYGAERERNEALNERNAWLEQALAVRGAADADLGDLVFPVPWPDDDRTA